MFKGHTSKTAGARGGKNKSKRKRKAAQVNGAKGGRPASRRLVDRMLNRKLSPDEEPCLEKAWEDLFVGEQMELSEYFQLRSGFKSFVEAQVGASKLNHIPRRIGYLIDRFKLAARYHSASQSKKKPKDYVVEYQPFLEKQHVLENIRRDTETPCPPRKVKIHFHTLRGFEHIDFMFKQGHRWTEGEICEAGGAQWTPKRARGLLAWLEHKYTGTKE